MAKLSDNDVAALVCPPGKKDVLVFDGTPKGFGVRVQSNGQKTFLLQYTAGGKRRRLPLGSFGKGRNGGEGLTVREARIKAHVHHGAVQGGADPHQEIVARKAALTAAAEVDEFTLRKLIDLWEDRHLAAKRESYRRDALARLNLHLKGIMARPAAGITRQEAVAELDRIAKAAGDTTARRVMGYARSAYGWAQKRGSINVNPFFGLPDIGVQVSRDRVLSDDEVAAIWRACEPLGKVHGGFVRFLLLTLARREEVARMTWAEVAPDLSTWTLPAARAKNRKAHVVRLSAAAQGILSDMPRIAGCPLVFALPSKKGLSVFSYIARKLTGPEIAEGWQFHDFRRTGVSKLAALEFPPHVCDRLLNHVQGTIKGVAAIYQRHDFAKERAAALDAWGAHVIARVGAASSRAGAPK